MCKTNERNLIIDFLLFYFRCLCLCLLCGFEYLESRQAEFFFFFNFKLKPAVINIETEEVTGEEVYYLESF